MCPLLRAWDGWNVKYKYCDRRGRAHEQKTWDQNECVYLSKLCDWWIIDAHHYSHIPHTTYIVWRITVNRAETLMSIEKKTVYAFNSTQPWTFLLSLHQQTRTSRTIILGSVLGHSARIMMKMIMTILLFHFYFVLMYRVCVAFPIITHCDTRHEIKYTMKVKKQALRGRKHYYPNYI